jgi:N-acetyl-gamma-glutamyl-phosphate reductase
MLRGQNYATGLRNTEMTPKVYIDGHVGTTGLRIRDWMADRPDVELLEIPEEHRKSDSARREYLQAADLAVLCLPDDASRQAAQWVAEGDARLLDASTAHRVHDGWVYGLPELSPAQRSAIGEARFVSNPGCYPSAFVLLVRPLVDAQLMPAPTPMTIHALSGYSGGGRSLIERWEDPTNALSALPFEAPYALDKVHKHIPEMQKFSGLDVAPQFVPAVGPFRCGMRVQIPVHASTLNGVDPKTLWEVLEARYRSEPFVRVMPYEPNGDAGERALDPESCNDTNRIDLHVIGNPSGHALLVGILDNLGKGASGVAIQNMNIMLGLGETTGLPATTTP